MLAYGSLWCPVVVYGLLLFCMMDSIVFNVLWDFLPVFGWFSTVVCGNCCLLRFAAVDPFYGFLWIPAVPLYLPPRCACTPTVLYDFLKVAMFFVVF